MALDQLFELLVWVIKAFAWPRFRAVTYPKFRCCKEFDCASGDFRHRI